MPLSHTLLWYLAHPLQYRLFSEQRCCLPPNRCSDSLLFPVKGAGIITERVMRQLHREWLRGRKLERLEYVPASAALQWWSHRLTTCRILFFMHCYREPRSRDEMHQPPFSLLVSCHHALIADSYFPSCGWLPASLLMLQERQWGREHSISPVSCPTRRILQDVPVQSEAAAMVHRTSGTAGFSIIIAL